MMYEDENTDAILLVDASNALNSLDRQSFLHNISYLFPSIAIFVKICLITALQGQEQPPEVFCDKRCSKKFRKIHRKKTVPQSLF